METPAARRRSLSWKALPRGRALSLVGLVVVGCATIVERPARQHAIRVDAQTPDGEALQAALRRLCPGSAAPLLRVVATREPPPDSLPVYLLDRVLPIAVPGGSLRVDAPCHISLLLGNRIVARKAVGDDAESVVFSVDAEELVSYLATVRVSIRDREANAPVSDGSVLWIVPGDSRLVPIRRGVSEIRHVPPGEGIFTYSGGLYAVRTIRLELQGGPVDAVVRLDAPATVEGRVAAPPGWEVPGHLFVLPLDTGLPPPPTWALPRIPIARDGAFAVKSGPRGPQALIVAADGCALAAVAVDNSAGPIRGVSIPLVRGVEVQLTTDRRGLATPFVQVETEASVPLYSSSLAEPRTIRLAAGKYRVKFRDFRPEWHAKTILIRDEDRQIRVP